LFLSIARLIVVLAGLVLGYLKVSPDAKGILIGTGIAILVLVVELLIQTIKLDDLFAAVIGLISGLILARLLGFLVEWMDNKPAFKIYSRYDLLLKIVFAYIGMLFVVRKKSELYLLDRDLLVPRTPPKRLLLLDTSVLVDGRILDIAKTGFMAGVLIVPEFILKEMHILSDSEDSFRRQRGRRALDILKNIQEDVPGVEVKITGKDYLNITADEKLVKLAEELKVPLVTNDFNLNKIATVKGVSVLNINQLANALKPVVLPGETLELMIVKEGKDHEQGVGYLEDGTMVVVEDGRSYIGERKKVFVQSILQTDAGRMVFVRVKKRETVR